ncbi:GNAT family N-acetyltransferase [Phenylobacterium sp.]|uniref:GNAT family N-acetyltransferase n=1 Tax=Phenylobacterium sp. TaxID=1871053 RepID=UPI00286A958F|nr:GNAT family N-acetyltransferase [Phenylobacterium sp.]
MSELVFRAAEPADLDRTVELMGLGFPVAHKFSRGFLQWQYYDNPAGPPLGCNIDDGARLVGHLMGIPLNVRRRGQPVTVTLIMNVATHPDFRGRGLFLELVRRVAEMSAARGHAGVVGVANAQTIRAYETRLSFQNVAGLEAHVEFLPQRTDMARALATADFAHRWTDDTLGWRLKNPANPLKIVAETADSLIVEGASSLPFVRARGAIPREGLTARGHGLAVGPGVVLGLTPAGTSRRRLALPIPERLRPSPLRMIWLNHDRPGDRLDPDRILFSFLDFDAF